MRKAIWTGALGSLLFTAALSFLIYTANTRFGNDSHLLWRDYGNGLFVATPILHGMAAGILCQVYGPQEWRVAAKATWLSVGLASLGVLVFAWEGIVCLLMAAPLVGGLALIGTWIGWRLRQRTNGLSLSLPTVGALALVINGGSIAPAPEADGAVVTTWWIVAPPERVWPHVLNLDSLPEPDWWLFRLGVAHPIGTRTEKDGTRLCALSTGLMPEVVTAREPDRRLAFRVLATPPSMKEWNPFGEVRAAHLTTTYRGREGEFRLLPERGGTRLVCRSTYGLRMGPAWYWRLWSDAIVAHVHERVVREIDRRSQAPLSSLGERRVRRGMRRSRAPGGWG